MTKTFRTLDDVDVKGKRVLLRVDLNVPMDAGKVTDTTRLERVMPTITELSSKGAKVILLAHFGRPKGRDDKNSLKPVAAALADVIKKPVGFADDCIGEPAAKAIAAMNDGDILCLENTRFHPEEEKNDPAFVDKLAELGAHLIVETLAGLPGAPVPQPDDGVTYAAKIDKAEAQLDWRSPAGQLERQVRAFNPFPSAVATLDGMPIKVWRAASMADGVRGAAPGTVVSAGPEGIVVACSEGALCLTELQKAGSRRLPVAQFLSGNPVRPGAAFALTA